MNNETFFMPVTSYY